MIQTRYILSVHRQPFTLDALQKLSFWLYDGPINYLQKLYIKWLKMQTGMCLRPNVILKCWITSFTIYLLNNAIFSKLLQSDSWIHVLFVISKTIYVGSELNNWKCYMHWPRYTNERNQFNYDMIKNKFQFEDDSYKCNILGVYTHSHAHNSIKHNISFIASTRGTRIKPYADTYTHI